MKRVANALLVAVCMLISIAGNAQRVADATIEGKMEVLSSSNNTLIVKLQVKAIHDTDPFKTLRMTRASLWFRYNDTLVSLAEQPVPATSATLQDGDYYYPNFANAYYAKKKVERQPFADIIRPDSKYCISHIVWNGWDTLANGDFAENPDGTFIPLANAEVVNAWTDVSIIRLKILKSGTLKLNWKLDILEDEVLDEVGYSYKIGAFDDMITTVVHQPEALKLTSEGNGTASDPYKVLVRSTSSSEPFAGTAGFYVYYRSADASAATGTDILKTGSFAWGNATIIDEPIASVSKDTVRYNRRLTFISADGTQSNDSWPALASAAREALHIVFTPTTNGTANGIKTFLETINAQSFKTWDESESHMTAVENAYKLLNVSGGGTGPLPVSLVDFAANLQDRQTVNLNWATASELDNAGFEIERSANGKTFEKIGWVKGHGTTSGFHAYAATDNQALPGLSYYRLKQVDFSKKAAYSKVVTISNTGKAEGLQISKVYPNPTNGPATLVFSLNRPEALTLKITDLLGRVIGKEVLQAAAGINTHTLAGVTTLPAGVYILTLSGNGQNAAYKIVKE